MVFFCPAFRESACVKTLVVGVNITRLQLVPPSKEYGRMNTVLSIGVKSFTQKLTVCPAISSVPVPGARYHQDSVGLTSAVVMSGSAVEIEFGVQRVATDLFPEESTPTTHA